MAGEVFEKCEKSLFFAVQIEKTEISILQREWKTKPFLEKRFLNLIYLASYGTLTLLIKIHHQLSCVI